MEYPSARLEIIPFTNAAVDADVLLVRNRDVDAGRNEVVAWAETMAVHAAAEVVVAAVGVVF